MRASSTADITLGHVSDGLVMHHNAIRSQIGASQPLELGNMGRYWTLDSLDCLGPLTTLDCLGLTVAACQLRTRQLSIAGGKRSGLMRLLVVGSHVEETSDK
jgi:hypothetical protein